MRTTKEERSLLYKKYMSRKYDDEVRDDVARILDDAAEVECLLGVVAACEAALESAAATRIDLAIAAGLSTDTGAEDLIAQVKRMRETLLSKLVDTAFNWSRCCLCHTTSFSDAGRDQHPHTKGCVLAAPGGAP